MSLLVSSGGGGGPITASDITDSSASGRTVLTGTAGEARAAISAESMAHNSDPVAHLRIVRRTIVSDLILTIADQPNQRIIPDADRNVTLPAESTSQWHFLLCHAGASYNLTVKRNGGTTVGVVIPGGVISCAWDGTGFGAC